MHKKQITVEDRCWRNNLGKAVRLGPTGTQSTALSFWFKYIQTYTTHVRRNFLSTECLLSRKGHSSWTMSFLYSIFYCSVFSVIVSVVDLRWLHRFKVTGRAGPSAWQWLTGLARRWQRLSRMTGYSLHSAKVLHIFSPFCIFKMYMVNRGCVGLTQKYMSFRSVLNPIPIHFLKLSDL